MAISFRFYADPDLTEPVDRLTSVHLVEGSDPVDQRVYFGSLTPARKVQDASEPGVAEVAISVVDAAPGEGHEPSAVRLATTQAGLDVATPGAPLALGSEVLSGAAAAIEIWVRTVDETGVVAASEELSLTTQSLVELPA